MATVSAQGSSSEQLIHNNGEQDGLFLAALVDDQGNEVAITDDMIQDALDTLDSFGQSFL